MLTACPDCGGSLGKSASKCRCGWKSAAVAQAQVAAEKKMTPCCADPLCKYQGRLWLEGLAYEQRVCVDHYYIAIDRDRWLAKSDTVPPKTMMPGVMQKKGFI